MTHRRHGLPILAIALVLIASTAGADTTDYAPDSAIVVVRIARMDRDPGVSWLSNSWLDADRESALREILAGRSFTEATLAVLPSAPGASQRLVLIIGMSSAPDPAALIAPFAEGQPTRRTTIAGTEVVYIQSPPPEADFSAVAVIGNAAIFGVDTGVMEEVLTGDAVTDSEGFGEISPSVDTGADGLLFADNADLKFADFLAPLERKWQMSLLLSAMDLEWMASGFDVVDSSSVSGTIAFKGSSAAAVPDIQDDAEFLGETFRRKFIAEDIQYSSNVNTNGTLVTLEFTVEGLEPLWLRLFEQGVLSVIRP